MHNVKWVEDYLNSLTDVTSIIVSHDSGLLDRVCTHIIQIDALKLHVHKGNLSTFVEANPQAKAYFELKSSKLHFKFPGMHSLVSVSARCQFGFIDCFRQASCIHISGVDGARLPSFFPPFL